jgi:hypothetical protein
MNPSMRRWRSVGLGVEAGGGEYRKYRAYDLIELQRIARYVVLPILLVNARRLRELPL